MPSTLAWLDHDPAERDRMHRILAQFKERDTRDELGLGSLRDAIADLLFPGTSTIQTRLRYMLFIAWMYRDSEERGVSSRQIASDCRAFEVNLTTSILALDPAAEGVFGRRAGGSLARLPSSVYWAGLGTWGIRRTPQYLDQYHQSLDNIYRRRAALRKLEDGDAVADPQTTTWHPKLPATPKGFPDNATFALSREEATFIRDCLATREQTRGSLLAWLTLNGRPAGSAYVWQHPQLAEFSEEHRIILDHGRRLSLLMYGAAVLYNIMLAEAAEHQERLNKYSGLWGIWLAEDIPGLDEWSLGDLWRRATASGHSPTPATLHFVQTWLELRLQGLDRPDSVQAARQLIAVREQRLKGPRARLHNRQMLLSWMNGGGDSGLFHLSYRWSTAQTFLTDLHTGLQAGG